MWKIRIQASQLSGAHPGRNVGTSPGNQWKGQENQCPKSSRDVKAPRGTAARIKWKLEMKSPNGNQLHSKENRNGTRWTAERSCGVALWRIRGRHSRPQRSLCVCVCCVFLIYLNQNLKRQDFLRNSCCAMLKQSSPSRNWASGKTGSSNLEHDFIAVPSNEKNRNIS